MPASVLLGDTLLTKDGHTFTGSVVRLEANAITFRTAQGTQVFPKATIRRISYGATAEDQAQASALQKQMAESQKRLQEARALREEQARQSGIARQQAEIKRVQDEQRKQNEELEKRKAAVLTVEDQLAKLAEEERKLDEQQKQIENRKREIEQQKERISGNPARPTKLSALWHSALLPGWGQYLSGRYVDAAIVPAVLLASAVETQREYSLFRRSGAANRSTGNFLLTAGLGSQSTLAIASGAYLAERGSQEQRKSARNLSAWLGIFSLSYVANLIDAYYVGASNARTTGRDPGPQVIVSVGQGTWNFSHVGNPVERSVLVGIFFSW